MGTLLYISLICVVFNIIYNCKTNSESANTCGPEDENKFEGSKSRSSVWNENDNRILSIIQKAEANYKPCEYKNASCFLAQMDNDLKPFADGISLEQFMEAKKSFSAAIHYQLVNHTLYRDPNCNYPSRCKGNEYFLRQLTNGEDFDLLINVYDWAVAPLYRYPHIPVFSFSKTKEYGDIMYPAWSFWSGGPAIKTYPTGLGRWDLHYKSLINEKKKWPWSKKDKKGFFCGSRTSGKRDTLIYFSLEHPNLVDARYTKNQAFKSIERDTLNLQPAEEVTMEHHCRYKYLFNFRGVAASFRFKYLFMCRSLVFHVEDEWIEFFYPSLKPWIHYIPLDSDFTKQQLMELLHFFKNHDEIAEKIAERGYKFIKSTLKMSNVEWYWKTLLEKYTKLLKFKVNLDHSLIKI